MRILAVKLSDLGDVLLCEPALRSLRTAFPDARIDVLTTPHAAALLPHFELRLEALTFEKSVFDAPGSAALRSSTAATRLARQLRSGDYDRVVLLHHLTTAWGAAKFRALARATGAPVVAGLDNGRGGFLTHPAIDRGFGFKHEVEYMLDVALAAGGKRVDAEPRYAATGEALPFDLPNTFIALAPAAGEFSSARIWPLEHYEELADQLVAAGHELVVLGGTDAISAGEQIVDHIGAPNARSIAGQTSLNELALVLKRAAIVVGNDSFPAHLAAAVGTPALALFGPSNPAAWAPRSARSRALTLDLPCSPCLYTGYRLGRRAGCPARSCLTQITPAVALERTLEMLGA